MTRHAILAVARRHEPCNYCKVRAGQPCTGGRGVHLCRICLAATDGLITMLDEISVMHDADAYTGAALILDQVTL